jgi:hypothetical protein
VSAVYTVRFRDHDPLCCMRFKRRQEGIATPKRELDLIRERLKWAERLHTGKAEGV